MPVAAAALLWWFLYSRNRPFWDWAIFDVVGLEESGRLGESLHLLRVPDQR